MSMRAVRYFFVLDGLRGIAAISVVLFHTSDTLAPRGYLGVDLFYILSGFVIAFSYKSALGDGLGFWPFLMRRLSRLYPMILAGSLLGLVAQVACCRYYLACVSTRDYGLAFLNAVFLAPQRIVTSFGDEAFPLNTAFWSLFFEIVANIFYAAFLYRMPRRVIAAIVLVSLASTLVLGLGGNKVENFWLGVPRVSFGFFGGILLFEVYSSGAFSNWRLSPLVLGAVLIMLFWAPFPIDGAALAPVYALFAFVVVNAANASDNLASVGAHKFLGDISYPVYALHGPFYLMLITPVRLMGMNDHAYPLMVSVVTTSIILGLSYLVLKFYDEPLRRALAAFVRGSHYRIRTP